MSVNNVDRSNQATSKEQWKRNIILFLSSQTISLFGSSLVQYAIMWYITLNTKSGIMMTLYIICGFIPTFLLSPVAGVWADRYNRKWLIMLSDGMIAFATLILALLFLMGYEEAWLLFVMAAIRALGSGVQTPAVGAILPQIVPSDQLTKVNGINGSIQAVIMFVSPIVSAALLTLATIETIFFIDVVTAAIAILTLLLYFRIPTHQRASGPQSTGYFHDLKEGLAYIRRQAYLKSFFAFMAVFFILMAPAAFLTPLQVTRTYGEEVWRLTAIEIAFSIGMMAGGGLIAAWGGFKNKVHTMTLATVLMGLCTFLLGVVPVFWIYLAFMTLFGIAMPTFNTPTMTMIQEKVDESYMGRIFGVFSMISTSMMPIGMLIFGPIADAIAIEWLLIATELLILLLSLFLGRNQALLEAGKPAIQEGTT